MRFNVLLKVGFFKRRSKTNHCTVVTRWSSTNVFYLCSSRCLDLWFTKYFHSPWRCFCPFCRLELALVIMEVDLFCSFANWHVKINMTDDCSDPEPYSSKELKPIRPNVGRWASAISIPLTLTLHFSCSDHLLVSALQHPQQRKKKDLLIWNDWKA